MKDTRDLLSSCQNQRNCPKELRNKVRTTSLLEPDFGEIWR